MADANRKPMIDRMTALIAGPFLLGRRALTLEWVDTPDSPPEPHHEAPARMTVTPPEHAIKRRG
jgi:hypothetical protein